MNIRTGLLTANLRATHTYMIGQPGTGKSRAIESWVMQDALQGRGVGVIDPHGDLFNNLLMRLTEHPSLWSRLVIIDPMDRDWIVGINPLEALDGYQAERIAQFMTDIMAKIWGLGTDRTPRLLWLMSNSFLALAEAELNLLDLPSFLLDKHFRDKHFPRIRNPLVRNYFKHEYPPSQAAAHQWATPLLNKIGALLFDTDIRLMLATKPSLDFQKLLDQSKILLVNLSKGILGEGASALVGAFIVARLQKAALARANQVYRKPFYLYLDEFQNYTTANIVDILAESRKYALSLTLAHQYLDQLTPDIRNAVLNTAGTLISFRIGYGDAVRLSKEIFPNGPIPDGRMKLRLEQNGLWPQMSLRREAANGSQTGIANQLTKLKPREFWAKRRGVSQATTHRSFNMPDVPMTNELTANIQRMRAISGKRYGKPKKEVLSAASRHHHNTEETTSRFWTR